MTASIDDRNFARIVLRPGRQRNLALVASVGWGVVFALVAAFQWPASQEEQRPLALLVLVTIWLICLLALGYYSRTVTVEFAEPGVRLFRGSGLKRELNWSKVAKVQIGTARYSVGRFRPDTGDYVLLFGRDNKVAMRVNSVFYTTNPGEIRRAGEAASLLARAKGIQVVAKNSRY